MDVFICLSLSVVKDERDAFLCLPKSLRTSGKKGKEEALAWQDCLKLIFPSYNNTHICYHPHKYVGWLPLCPQLQCDTLFSSHLLLRTRDDGLCQESRKVKNLMISVQTSGLWSIICGSVVSSSKNSSGAALRLQPQPPLCFQGDASNDSCTLTSDQGVLLQNQDRKIRKI